MDRRWVAVLGIALAMGACGGAEDEGSGDLAILSSDGRAELIVPEGAVPEGTEITIGEGVAPESLLMPGATAVAYSMEPDGLAFSSPATLAVELDPGDGMSLPIGLVVLVDSAGEAIVMSGEFSEVDGRRWVEIEVPHFSTMVVLTFPGSEREYEVLVDEDCPAIFEVGDHCTVVVPEAGTMAHRVSFALAPGAEGSFRLEQADEERATFTCTDAYDHGPFARIELEVDWRADEAMSGLEFYSPGINARSTLDLVVECRDRGSAPPSDYFQVSSEGRTYVLAIPRPVLPNVPFEVGVCGTDIAGEPLTGSGFITISPSGDPADSSAVHGNAPFGVDGCISIPIVLGAGSSLGSWTVWTFDEAAQNAILAGTVEVGDGDALPAGTLPDERRASGRGIVTETYTDDDRPRIETALAEVRVTLGGSCRGGSILVSSGSLSEGPSGHFYPDGSGGFVWDDNTRHDSEDGVQLEDADEVSGVTFANGALSFEWTRTNFDGSTWTVPISVPTPEGAENWWAQLGAPGPAPYIAEYQAEEQDGSLVVTGTTDAPDGTVFEVLSVSGDRFPVEVVDGVFQVTVPGATGSGGSSAQVLHGAHILGCSSG